MVILPLNLSSHFQLWRGEGVFRYVELLSFGHDVQTYICMTEPCYFVHVGMIVHLLLFLFSFFLLLPNA